MRLRTRNYHVKVEESNSCERELNIIPSKASTEFKIIKGFVPPPECESETGMFKGSPEIKEEIDAAENICSLKL